MSSLANRMSLVAQQMPFVMHRYRFAVAASVAAQNWIVMGSVAANVGLAKGIPSGVMLNVSLNGQAHGLAGGFTASLYIDRQLRLYLIFSPEVGFAPMGAYTANWSQSSAISFTYGLIWNAASVADLEGPSTTATVPFGLAHMFYLMNPLNGFRLHQFMTNLGNYESGRNADRQGIAQFMQSLTGSTVGIYGGTRSYSWGATFSSTLFAVQIADTSKLLDALDDYLSPQVAAAVNDVMRQADEIRNLNVAHWMSLLEG